MIKCKLKGTMKVPCMIVDPTSRARLESCAVRDKKHDWSKIITIISKRNSFSISLSFWLFVFPVLFSSFFLEGYP